MQETKSRLQPATISIQQSIAKSAFLRPQAVKKISRDAFKRCRSPVKITIPESVFPGCTSWERVTMLEAVTWIGDMALAN